MSDPREQIESARESSGPEARSPAQAKGPVEALTSSSASSAAERASSPESVEVERVRHRVALAREGDQRAWNEIDSEIRRSVVARLPLPRHVDRDEVSADTVSEVWKALRNLRDDQKLLAFAATVARRVAAKKMREGSNYLPLIEEACLGETSDVAETVQSRLDHESLVGRLSSSLKAADRKLFRMLYVAGKSTEEVQSELGIPGSIVRQRKHRLHQRLKRHIKDE